MRISRYRVVSIQEDLKVNLKSLTPMEQIITAIRVKLYNTNRAQMRRQEEANRKHREYIEKFETLRDNISNFCIKELLKDYPDEVKYIDATVNRSYYSALKDVVKCKDLSKFNIKIFETNSNMLEAFPDLPIKIRISLRKI